MYHEQNKFSEYGFCFGDEMKEIIKRVEDDSWKEQKTYDNNIP